MTKDEFIQAIRQSALSESEVMELIRALMEKLMGDQMIAAGMDLLTGKREGDDDA